MSRGLFWCRLFLVLGALAAFADARDTGTYEIADYQVVLFLQADGKARISYRQDWKVTGGHIPWITIGTANSDFEVLPEETGGSAAAVERVIAREFTGVRVDLDRDYQPGERFAVELAVLQAGLLFSAEGGYRLDFIPGWYERARTGRLVLVLESFAGLEGLAAGPRPDAVEPGRLLWERTDLAPGGRLHVSVLFPAALFPEPPAIAPSAGGSGAGRGSGEIGVVVAVVLAVLGGVGGIMAVIIARAARRARRYGPGGDIGVAGTGIAGRGCIVSCACACVACACACACAGGGGAGCDRKITARRPAREAAG